MVIFYAQRKGCICEVEAYEEKFPGDPDAAQKVVEWIKKGHTVHTSDRPVKIPRLCHYHRTRQEREAGKVSAEERVM